MISDSFSFLWEGCEVRREEMKIQSLQCTRVLFCLSGTGMLVTDPQKVSPHLYEKVSHFISNTLACLGLAFLRRAYYEVQRDTNLVNYIKGMNQEGNMLLCYPYQSLYSFTIKSLCIFNKLICVLKSKAYRTNIMPLLHTRQLRSSKMQ